VVPSLTLDPSGLAKLSGATFYEERLLFLLIRLRNPHARLVYVTSQPVHPMVLEYYLQLLAGIPGSHARARLTLLCAYDASPRPLTQKVLERPRLIQRIREAIPDRDRAYLTVFNSTPLERRLAVLLGIPSNGVDPELAYLGTKSAGRKVIREAGVEVPAGVEDLHSREDVEEALLDLRGSRPGLPRAVLKLNDGFSTPSVQLRVNPLRQTTVSSTHEQVLGGPTGQGYLGCRFPAEDVYRVRLQEAGLRIGRVLAGKGVVSRLSVDFTWSRFSPWTASASAMASRRECSST
jgi:hypothetical protein